MIHRGLVEADSHPRVDAPKNASRDADIGRNNSATPPRRCAVLHVIDGLETGGAEQQLATFLVRSDRSHFHHEVCALSGGGRFQTPLSNAGIPVHVLGVQPQWDFLRSVLALRDLVRTIEPDLLHATLFRPGVVSRIVGRLCGKPVITTLVNTTYEPEWRMDNPFLSGWKIAGVKMLDAFTAQRWGRHFVAITDTVKMSAIQQLGILPEHVSVIPRGFGSDAHEPLSSDEIRTVRRELDCEGATPVILSVGRLVPQKGHRYLIAAMTDVLRELPAAKVLIAGTGWLQEELQALARRRGVDQSVSFLGVRTDIERLLAAADLFVFPSLYEGFGVALLEAMAQGKPCVVSDIPVLREVTDGGKQAWLVPARSEQALANAIVTLGRDRHQAKQLGDASRQWARQRYDISKSVAALEALYMEVAPSRSAG